MGDLAAGLSYRFILALFPFFIFVAALGAFVSRLVGTEDPSSEIVQRFASTIPEDARAVLTDQLDAVLGNPQPGLLSVGIAGALWAAASGMSGLMRAMNIAYDVPETRPLWRRVGIAVGLTFLSGILMVAAFILAVAGAALVSAVTGVAGLGTGLTAAITVLRWAAIVALLLVATAFLFAVTPDADLPVRWITPGATAFIVAWLVTTLGFGWYASNFGSYNATYGALGGLIVLMLWSYLTAYVMLAGAELNALLARLNSERLAQQGAAPAHGIEGTQRAHGGQAPEGAPGAGRSHPPEQVGSTAAPNRRGLVARSAGALVAFVALARVIPRPARGED